MFYNRTCKKTVVVPFTATNAEIPSYVAQRLFNGKTYKDKEHVEGMCHTLHNPHVPFYKENQAMNGELISVMPLPALPALANPMAILAATRPDDFTWLESKRMDTALAIRRVDLDIARVQANRDVSVAQIWARRDVDVARISARRDVDIAQIQADRDVAVTRLQTHRDVAVAHASVACQWLNVRNGQKHFRMCSRGDINQTTEIDTW